MVKIMDVQPRFTDEDNLWFIIYLIVVAVEPVETVENVWNLSIFNDLSCE